MRSLVVSASILVGVMAGMSAVTAAELKRTSCVLCHTDPARGGEAGARIVRDFRADTHAAVGLSCHDCHGGDPDPSLANDQERAKRGALPYTGVVGRAEIPAFCGSCHSDLTKMRRYDPGARVDQEQEYWTSEHGRRLREGSTAVATCIDCHGVHGMLPASDPGSKVHPRNVAGTCNDCHGDALHMEGVTLPDGRPLPLDQYTRWKTSVHASNLLERGDLSSPTCNDCHGNHGAAPPGLDSVAFVCGQCHGREAELFRKSSKHEGLLEHQELLTEVEDGCRECHELPEPAASFVTPPSLSECVTCHDNHAVVRSTVAMLGRLPPTPCAYCHEVESLVTNGVREQEAVGRHYEEKRDRLVAEAGERGLRGNEAFDWLVDQALEAPHHRVGSSNGEVLRPEFERLFRKFRIGKSTHVSVDAETGGRIQTHIVQCADCHAENPELADGPVGLHTAEVFRDRMRELTASTARATRLLLAARRGGVSVREALASLDQAVDSQVELEVLVHSFDAGDESPFMKKHAEGIEHARSALASAQGALAELSRRRTGLAVFLLVLVPFMVVLGLKIRQLP